MNTIIDDYPVNPYPFKRNCMIEMEFMAGRILRDIFCLDRFPSGTNIEILNRYLNEGRKMFTIDPVTDPQWAMMRCLVGDFYELEKMHPSRIIPFVREVNKYLYDISFFINSNHPLWRKWYISNSDLK